MAQLFVIAGHGAGDPGASAYGYTEAERVRALAYKLQELGGDSVTLGDTSRNWYEDNGISYLNIPTSTQIIELHMDSASAGAQGGHVIVNGNYSADNYDWALASFIGDFMPGRANTLVYRTDLANSNRAAARGFSYRLLECGFISNYDDLTIFNNHIETLARGILQAFDITPAETVGWIWSDYANKYWYKYSDGTYPKNEWAFIGDYYFHFDEDGYMQTGWFQENNEWYFLTETGAMAANQWKEIDGHWFYFSDSGAMCKNGFYQIQNSWFYFNEDGYMQTGWISGDTNDVWYYCKADGSMVSDNWEKIDEKWFYFNASGEMLVGLQKINGTTYLLNDKHDGSFGAMQTGWQELNKNTYYFSDSGAMALNTCVFIENEWFAFNQEGQLIKGNVSTTDTGALIFKKNN